MISNKVWPPPLSKVEQTVVLGAADRPAEASVLLLEESLAATVGASEAIAFSSCTTAIHGVVALLRPESATVTAAPAFTFAGTWTGAAHLGHAAVFADVHPETLNLEHQPRADLVIAVDLHGVPHSLDRAQETLITDACQSLGTRVSGELLGGQGIHCWSFSPAKAVPSFAGGAVTTNDAELAQGLRAIRDYGITGGGPRAAEPCTLPWGHNWRMTGPDAALAASRLHRALEPEGWIDRMHAVGEVLRSAAKSAGFFVQTPPLSAQVAWHKLRIGLDHFTAQQLGEALTSHKISWHLWGLPMDQTFPWQHHAERPKINVSRKVAAQTLCVTTETKPFWVLSDSEVARIASTFARIVEDLRSSQ